MPNAARELNFVFRGAEIPYQNLSGAANFALFTSGNRGRRIYNLMTGTIDNLALSIFDFAYTNHSSSGSSSSSHTHTYTQTVVMINFEHVRLPAFHLQKQTRGIVNELNKAFGYESNAVAFPTHPVFSQNYALIAGNETEFGKRQSDPAHISNEAQLRYLFNDTILSFYENDLGLLTECSGSRLIFYRDNTKIEPHQLRNAVNEALTAIKLFFAAGNI